MEQELIATYEALGYTTEEAREEAAREIRLTTGDPYYGRSEEELAEMHRIEADQVELARQTAGVTEEFPMGEFAVPGFNCDFDHEDYC